MSNEKKPDVKPTVARRDTRLADEIVADVHVPANLDGGHRAAQNTNPLRAANGVQPNATRPTGTVPKTLPQDDSSSDGGVDTQPDMAKRKRSRPGKAERELARLESQNAVLRSRIEDFESQSTGANASSHDIGQGRVTAPPQADDFGNYQDYLMALVQHQTRTAVRGELAAERQARAIKEAEQEQQAMFSQYQARVGDASERYPDFNAVVSRPDIPLAGHLEQAILSSEMGPDLAYHLGSNPNVAEQLAGLSPLNAVLELGRIEARLSAEHTTSKPKPTTAPAPVPTVGGTTVATLDPEHMSMDEYRKHRAGG